MTQERYIRLGVVALVITFVAACSSANTEDIMSRIAAVEKNLVASVIDSRSEPAGMTLPDRLQHYQVPGISIAVINNGEFEWAKGYGVAEAGGSQAVTPDTVFQACSVSKPVSVTGIMLLAQWGGIDISRNVNDYLTSWRLADNALTSTQKATIQRLMSHTAGINVSGYGGYITIMGQNRLLYCHTTLITSLSPYSVPDRVVSGTDHLGLKCLVLVA